MNLATLQTSLLFIVSLPFAPPQCNFLPLCQAALFHNAVSVGEHLAVQLSLLPLHFIDLGLESLVLIGQHLQPVLQCRALLLVPTNVLAVDLVLE